MAETFAGLVAAYSEAAPERPEPKHWVASFAPDEGWCCGCGQGGWLARFDAESHVRIANRAAAERPTEESPQ